MKKSLFFNLLLLLLCNTAVAQVHYFDGSLNEAMSKAKNEDKTVMVIASTTWCAPCKEVEEKFLSQKEFTDRFDSMFIFKKYLLDKSDQDNIVNTYGVSVYPTFIFIDGNGDELTRMTGGAKTLDAFMERIENATSDENSIKSQAAKFDSDPSYAMEYINFLSSIKKYDMIEGVLSQMFERLPLEQCFAPDFIEYYQKNVSNISSCVIKQMAANEKQISAIMGAKNYVAFMRNKGIDFLINELYTPFRTKEKIEQVVKEVNSIRSMKSEFSILVQKNLNLFIYKDLVALMPLVEKKITKCGSHSRKALLNVLVESLPQATIVEYKDKVIQIHQSAIEKEGDDTYRKGYERVIAQLQKSEQRVVRRMK